MVSPEPWRRHLAEHLNLAREGRDPEGVHQVRVAAGRLDVWLRLARLRALRDDVRWLRRRAADVRDLDVLLADRPPDAWLPWLRRRRATARRALLAALDAPRLEGLLLAFGHLPPLPEDDARAGVRRLARRALERGTRLEEDADHDLARFHAVRRALRRLRYGLEWVGEEEPALEALQDAFGALNDLAVARRLLAAYRGRAALAAWGADLEARAASARTAVLAAWTGARAVVTALGA